MDTPFLPQPLKCDLLLVFPPFQRLVVSMENIGIEYIASYARAQKFNVRIINAGLHGLTVDDIILIAKRSRFEVLGISTIHWTITEALEIAKAVKYYHPNCHIIMGGIEAALSAEKILTKYAFVDSIGVGEGELTVSELLASILNGKDWKSIKGLAYREGDSVAFNPQRQLIDPLDPLPFPARDDIAAVVDSGGPVSVSTSRGCFGRCSFCSVWAFYHLSKGRCWRGRSPSSVVREICEIHENYGVSLFSFIDETVVGPGKEGPGRLREIATRIMESRLKIDFFLSIRADQVDEELFRELKQAGLRKVEIGIESMAQSQLKRYGKSTTVEDNQRALRILEGLNISSETFMIPYDPDVTYHEVKQNLIFYQQRFTKPIKTYEVAPLTMGHYLYPYPGTKTRNLYDKRGWLGSDHYIPFRATDEVMTRVQRAVHWFTTYIEPAFPMSFAGLGNLWINSKGLPGPIYRKICEICVSVGILLIELTEWAYGISSRSSPVSVNEINAISSRLWRFLSEAAILREEVRNIIETYGGCDKRPLESLKFPNIFARQLYLLGQQRRRSTINNIYVHSFSADDIIDIIINVLAKEGKADTL